MSVLPCHCGTHKSFHECCHPFLKKISYPATAEQLMRSRYSAFVEKNSEYLKNTTHPITRDEHDYLNLENITWLKLIVFSQEEIKKNLDQDTVEFVAHYQTGSSRSFIHEKSTFHYLEGQWFYHSGINPNIKNYDPCPCGSKRKSKKCCA